MIPEAGRGGQWHNAGMTTPQFVLDLRAKIGHAPLWMPGVKGVVLRHAPAPSGAAASASDPAASGTEAQQVTEALPVTEVLLVKRRDNGRWTVPAGILEPGEEPADAMVREVWEEAGIRARALRLVGVQTTQPTVYPNGDQAQYLDVVMALEAVSGEAHVNDDENLAVQWRAVDALEDVPPLHRRAIDWARSQDPRFADPDAAHPLSDAAWFVSAGEVRRAAPQG